MVEPTGALTLPTATPWWGPNGHTLLSYEVDLSGGGSRLRLRSPEGIEYWVDDVHLEIVEPERIVFTGVLEDTGGQLTETPRTLTFRRLERE